MDASQYHKDREGFQACMLRYLAQDVSEVPQFAETVAVPELKFTVNGTEMNYEQWVERIKNWIPPIENYEPEVDFFVRDGNRMAAHCIGRCLVNGEKVEWETNLFAVLDEATDKMTWLLHNTRYGPIGQKLVEGGWKEGDARGGEARRT